ncbi:hypothetical protein BC629DRAFT_881006 [Irpex lacteus]|nr:hypothetical protein BC629DRAFT_881006 [Irpex lacteus]
MLLVQRTFMINECERQIYVTSASMISRPLVMVINYDVAAVLSQCLHRIDAVLPIIYKGLRQGMEADQSRSQHILSVSVYPCKKHIMLCRDLIILCIATYVYAAPLPMFIRELGTALPIGPSPQVSGPDPNFFGGFGGQAIDDSKEESSPFLTWPQT